MMMRINIRTYVVKHHTQTSTLDSARDAYDVRQPTRERQRDNSNTLYCWLPHRLSETIVRVCGRNGVNTKKEDAHQTQSVNVRCTAKSVKKIGNLRNFCKATRIWLRQSFMLYSLAFSSFLFRRYCSMQCHQCWERCWCWWWWRWHELFVSVIRFYREKERAKRRPTSKSDHDRTSNI